MTQFAGVSAARTAGRDFLKHPPVAIGIAERRERSVTVALWVRAGYARRGPGVVKYAACVVEDIADLCAMADELGAGGLDVVYHEVQTIGRAGCGRGDSVPKMIEQGDPGGVSCTTRQVITVHEIGVQPPAQPH
ncbi:MAG: hypothetical protein QOJ20_5064 [Mycobacterium sp.]|jgi:hypothetical protein|nr:hypothetical protein [Mycobacterium sp.]